MKAKLSIVLVGLVAATVALSGCGKSDNGNATNDPGKSESNSPSSSVNNSDASETSEPVKNMTLKISLTPQDLPGIEELSKQYETDNPGVKFEITRAPDDQFITALNAGLASQDAPDMFLTWPGVGSAVKYAKNGNTEDLSGLTVMNNVDPGLLIPFTNDGKTYGIPWGINVLGLYYNKEMFAANDLQVPTNWDEFMQVCETLLANGITPIAFAGKEQWEVQLPWYQMVPTTVYSKDIDWDKKRYADEVKFATSEGWIEAKDKYKTLLEKGYFGKNILGVAYDQAKQLLSTGKAAMMIDGSWALQGYKDLAAQGNLKLGMFAFPANAPGQELWLSKSPTTGLAIWSGSENKDEAKKFIDYIFSDANDIALIGKGNNTSLRSVKAETDPILDDIMPIVQNNNSYPFLDAGWPTGPQTEALIKETQAAIGGASTFEKALESADKNWEKGVKQIK